ncbi:MAG TPA: UpxY family transcription antiterminator [Salinivirgaceae bacterium]|nr:UpxY family transcription antiterminator [Salinivirgaceae bacterium]
MNPEWNDKRWYVISVRSRHEKKVAKELNERGVECYVPLIKTLRQWQDRKKMVQIPLINCYVFAYLDYQNRNILFNIPGFVRFVMFEGKPATLRDQDIRNMKIVIENTDLIEITPHQFYPGQTVKIMHGPFAGYEGTVVSNKNRMFLVISLDFMSSVIKVEISSKFLSDGTTIY